ncbi:MAG: glycosyl hydrolase family 8, partial [Firmicutes bacterium]|nr:glycosyl hydrolase family 8 [Bacillota bacterium]
MRRRSWPIMGISLGMGIILSWDSSAAHVVMLKPSSVAAFYAATDQAAVAAPIASWNVTGTVTPEAQGQAQVQVRLPAGLPAGDLLDIEIHQAGQKVWQTWTTAAGLTQWEGTADNLPAGTLHLDVGIFSANWAQQEGWWQHVATWNESGAASSTENVSTAANAAFQSWQNTYVQSVASGVARVIRPQNNNDTVSEGMGYGMVLAAVHKDPTLFSSLWAYTQRYLDDHGLMNWKISAEGQVTGTGSATDADEDIAYALLLAHKEWPGQGYG